jgi:uncharacterized membrane protein (DUF2068 family)
MTLAHIGGGLATAGLGFLILIALKISLVEFGFGFVLVLLGIISIATAYGLWNALSWVRWIARTSGALYVIVGILLALTSGAALVVLGAFSIVLGLISILFWNLRWTKGYAPT